VVLQVPVGLAPAYHSRDGDKTATRRRTPNRTAHPLAAAASR